MTSRPVSADPADFLAWYAGEVFERRRLVDPYCDELVRCRFIVTLFDLEHHYLQELPAEAKRMRARVNVLASDAEELHALPPPMQRYLDEAGEQLGWPAGEPDRASWRTEPLSESVTAIPGMQYPDAMRYYKWLARHAPACGEIVELGPWLGLATACLAEGLAENAARGKRRVRAFDTFVWQEWMTRFGEGTFAYREGDSFLDAFLRHTEPYRALVHAVTVTPGEAEPAWRDPVSVLLIDHTDRYDDLERTWRAFSPWFVAGETVVVFNQYGNARAEQVRAFCHDRAAQLTAAHKPRSSAKGFRYLG